MPDIDVGFAAKIMEKISYQIKPLAKELCWQL
jgi:hypothetical protein